MTIAFPQCRVSEPTLQSFSDQRIVEMRGQVESAPEFENRFSRLSLSAQEIKVVIQHFSTPSGELARGPRCGLESH